MLSVQVEERVYELEELEVQVERAWGETKLLYEEELEILLLQRELEQAERWLSSYENTLMAEEYGVRLRVCSTLRPQTVEHQQPRRENELQNRKVQI